MSQSRDPEQLLAQALRAQASGAGTPVNAPEAESSQLAEDPGPLPNHLSGTVSDGAGDPSEHITALPGMTEETAATTPAGYGLLSGTGAESLERERAALDATDTPTQHASTDTATSDQTAPRSGAAGPQPATRTRRAAPSAPVPARWVLLIAVLLGLAAGSVIGLLTLF